MKLDFSQLMKVYAKRYERFFHEHIRTRKGIDESGYSQLGAWANVVKPKRNRNSRLNPPGSNFPKQAFKATATETSIRIEGNVNQSSRRGTSYNDVIQYNNRGSAYVNRNINDPPLIAPNTGDEFANISVTQDFMLDLKKTIQIQLGDAVKDIQIPKKIVIGK